MPEANDLAPALETWVRHEQVIDRFESAWRRGERPAIDGYLAEAGADRQALLVELVHADLEYRLKRGEAARVEGYLERYPELAAAPQPVLDLLMREYELRSRQEPGLSRAEYLRRFPALASELRRQPATELLSGTPWLGTTPIDLNGSARSPAASPGLLPRYRPQRFHARGGLGEVWVAHDEELDRDVALKCLRPGHAADPERCRRFLREARLTARLGHPGVVPVHGLIWDADGQPRYAMRFIEGATLADAIRRYHAGEPGWTLHALLTRFVAACQTVAYAHSRGVLHRDLKPANIMLGDYGETLVVDWGLAKARGPDAEGEGEPTVPPLPDADRRPLSSATQLGDVLGTPAYMSPEQAAGDWDRVGPASDIYSLGATLYGVLTGKAPFEGDAPTQLLTNVRRAPPPPPRERKGGVPVALEAVCLKAMAREPEHRYATARDLAAEVERWLADEPVRAYPEPLAARFGRWGRRHRPVVAATLVFLAACVLGLAVGLGALAREQARTVAARDEARESFRQARHAVDELLTEVSENDLLNVPGLQPLRRQLLRKALQYYEGFLSDRADDPGLRREVAAAHFRVAQITAEIGTPEDIAPPS